MNDNRAPDYEVVEPQTGSGVNMVRIPNIASPKATGVFRKILEIVERGETVFIRHDAEFRIMVVMMNNDDDEAFVYGIPILSNEILEFVMSGGDPPFQTDGYPMPADATELRNTILDIRKDLLNRWWQWQRIQ